MTLSLTSTHSPGACSPKNEQDSSDDVHGSFIDLASPESKADHSAACNTTPARATPALQIARALRDTYGLEEYSQLESEVETVLSEDFLRMAKYPFSKGRLPASEDTWQRANYRFAAYGQLSRIVFEACDALGVDPPAGRLQWDDAGVVAACVRQLWPSDSSDQVGSKRRRKM